MPLEESEAFEYVSSALPKPKQLLEERRKVRAVGTRKDCGEVPDIPGLGDGLVCRHNGGWDGGGGEHGVHVVFVGGDGSGEIKINIFNQDVPVQKAVGKVGEG